MFSISMVFTCKTKSDIKSSKPFWQIKYCKLAQIYRPPRPHAFKLNPIKDQKLSSREWPKNKDKFYQKKKKKPTPSDHKKPNLTRSKPKNNSKQLAKATYRTRPKPKDF